MTGVVFIICVPVEKHEKYLKSKTKKVIIKENNGVSTVLNDRVKERLRVDDVIVKEAERVGVSPENSPVRENYEYISMFKLIKDILDWYNLDRTTSTHSIDENYVQFLFSIEEGSRCEEIVNILRDHNVGQKFESIISIIPCSLHYQGCQNTEDVFASENNQTNKIVGDTAWTRFVSSVRARLTVAQIVEDLKADAAFTFDFICLLISATILCAIGLVENSDIYLLPSVLISPMMGPVMAATFGTVIRDRALLKVGVQSELIGLGIAMLVGFCCGSIICMCTDKYGDTDWPTRDMISWGEIRTLGVGCLLALVSGAAVAVGVLSDNIASLVGVAVSSSLMPPAVNAGLLWSLASVYYLKGNETTRYAALTYTEYYSKDRFYELSSLGAISLCLTFVNIVCIYVAAIAVFKIKEVAPMSSKHHAIHQFWKYDIKIARDYNKTLQRGEGLRSMNLQDEIYNYKKEVNDRYQHFHHSNEFPKEDFQFNIKKCQYTWSPCTCIPPSGVDELYNIRKEKILNIHGGHHRRLSQIFSNELLPSVKSDEALLVVPKVVEKRKSKGKKFTVTPCDVDALKNI